tara:strand:+ start:616 stop:879 length:264 start_codon:yes stop_codon:yes gene_type:complete
MVDVTSKEQSQIEEANLETLQFLIQILKGKNPMIVAGVMAAMALGVYKSILRPEEYDMMVDSISASRDHINTLGLLLDDSPTDKVLH